MKLRRNLFIALGLTVLLTACGDKVDQSVHDSNDGFTPEAYLPADVGLVVSYSTRSEEQFNAIQALEANLGDSDRISETASEALDTELGDLGLDFERDLKPAFGERFRMVYAMRPTESEPENFSIITLEDSEKMKEVLTTLVDADRFTFKKLSDIDVYIPKNESEFITEESSAYLTIYEDMLFVASSGESLVAMTEQDEDSSLLKGELYKDTLEEVGSDYSLFGVMFPSLYSEDLSLLAGFSVSDVPSVVDKQVIVVRAEEKGFRFEAWVNANKSKAKEAGISFDSVPKSDPYLFEEIPADGLLSYFESYGLSQTFAEAAALGDDTESLEQMKEGVRSLFGMDFEDIMSFLDKGYAFSLHSNGTSFIPGLTIYVDISSNPDMAEEFMNKLDGQLGGLLILADSYLPGALTKDTVSWGEDTFSRLKLDLNAVAQLSGGALPEEVTDSSLELVYGVTTDRIVVSTVSDWDSEGDTIADSPLYKSLDAQLEETEGLIMVDAHGISEYIKKIQALSGELAPEETEQLASITNFLDGFLGFMARSKTEAYESHFSGFLMLAE